VSERLTKRKDYGCACWNGDQNLVTHRRYSEMLEALAKYEDVIFDADGNEVISLKELSQLLQSKREGRVVVLPEIGDRLFYAPYPKGATDLDGKPIFWRNTGDGSGEVKNVHVLVTFDNWMGRIPINRTWKTKQESEAERALSSAGEGAE